MVRAAPVASEAVVVQQGPLERDLVEEDCNVVVQEALALSGFGISRGPRGMPED